MASSEIPCFPRSRRHKGFSVLEALTGLAVASILITAAVPAMQDFIVRNRLSTEVNTFVASLNLARSEAVKRLQNVGVCPVDSSGNCDPSTEDWEQGWKVYYLDPASGTEKALQQSPALPNRFKIVGNQSGFAYDPTGQLVSAGTNGTYTFCDTGNVAQARDVIVSSEGRVRTHLNTTGCTSGSGGGGG
jgi:type IV fimbrial biogenesis protein FimT